jgi:hypothetical protein
MPRMYGLIKDLSQKNKKIDNISLIKLSESGS